MNSQTLLQWIPSGWLTAVAVVAACGVLAGIGIAVLSIVGKAQVRPKVSIVGLGCCIVFLTVGAALLIDSRNSERHSAAAPAEGVRQ